MDFAIKYSNGQQESESDREYRLAVSAKATLTAIEEGEKALYEEFKSLAVAHVLGTGPTFLREYLQNGYKTSTELVTDMTNQIKERLEKPVAAIGRTNSLDSLHIDLFTPKQIMASLTRIANEKNLGDSQSDQVATQLVKAFIKGVDKSLREKVSAHRDELSRYR